MKIKELERKLHMASHQLQEVRLEMEQSKEAALAYVGKDLVSVPANREQLTLPEGHANVQEQPK